MIRVGNQGPIPIEITHIGFRLSGGTPLMQINPYPAFSRLPVIIQPTSGTRLGYAPDKLAESLRAKPVGKQEELTDVYCSDGSGRDYVRSLSKKEREAVREALTRVRSTDGHARA